MSEIETIMQKYIAWYPHLQSIANDIKCFAMNASRLSVPKTVTFYECWKLMGALRG